MIGCALGELIKESAFRKSIPNLLYTNNCFSCFKKPIICAYLHSIGIIEEFRRKGIGSLLLKSFLKECEEKNAVAVYCETLIYDKIPGYFFLQNGWKDFGSERDIFNVKGNILDAKKYAFLINEKYGKNEGFRQSDIALSNSTQNINYNNYEEEGKIRKNLPNNYQFFFEKYIDDIINEKSIFY